MLNSITGRFQSTGVGTLTIAAPGKAGQYNLVKSIAAHGTATATIAICSPSVTSVIWSGVISKREITGPLVVSFPLGGEPRGAENGAIKVTCSAGTYRLNITGVVEG